MKSKVVDLAHDSNTRLIFFYRELKNVVLFPGNATAIGTTNIACFVCKNLLSIKLTNASDDNVPPEGKIRYLYVTTYSYCKD